MGTVSSTTHIKTISSFSPGIGKHFHIKALYSSDNSVTQLVHILQDEYFLLQTPRIKYLEETNLENVVARELTSSSFPINGKLGTNMIGEVRW
jgi:hypothetical protein